MKTYNGYLNNTLTNDFVGEKPVDGQMSVWHTVDSGINHGRTTALCGASLIGITEIQPRNPDVHCGVCFEGDG